jgi:hypothetical protein
MFTTDSQPFSPRCPLLVLALLVAGAASARGQDVYDRDDDYVPTGARRAANWHPTRQGIVGEPWQFSGTVGVAYFSGDRAVRDNAGFTAEARLSHDLAENFYLVGSYLLGFARTEVTDPDTGSADRDTVVLNVPTIGLGFRGEVTPEIHLFVEPRLGLLFGPDADTAPAGGASAGVDIQLQPGLDVRVAFTGLATDSELDTSAGDKHLSGIWSVGVGLAFEF